MDTSVVTTRSRKFKHKIFMFASEQLLSLLANPIIFILGRLIELFQFQIIAFTVHEQLFPNSSAASVLHNASDFFMIGIIGKEARRFVVIPIILLILFLQVFIICQMPSNLTRFKPPYFLTILIKISAVYIVVFKLILIIPFQYTILEIFSCIGFDECLNTEHIIWLIFAILAQCGLFFEVILILFFVREDKPESYLPWACYSGIVPYLRYFIRFCVSLLLWVGLTWDTLKPLPIIISVVSLAALIMRWKQGGDHRIWSNLISAMQEIFTFCLHLAVFFTYLLNQPEIAIFSAIAITPSLLFVFEIARQWREERIMKTTLPAQQQNVIDVEIYINNLMEYIRDPANSQNYMQMSSLLVLHSETCEDLECVCKQLRKFTTQKYMLLGKGEGQNMRNDTNIGLLSNFMDNYNQVKERWYKFFILLIQDALLKFQKNPAMHLQLSYLYLKLFKNCYMALYSAQNATVYRPSLTLQFDIFHQVRIIEYDLAKHISKISKTRRHIIHVDKNIEYMTQLNIFQETAEACIIDHQQYWTLLLDTEPDTTKLFHYGSRITQNVLSIRKVYKNIMDITSTNLAFLYKYALFLKNVIHDDIEAHTIVTKILNSREISGSADKKWNCWEGHSLLIRASGDRKTLSQIRDVSIECEQILGYTKKELIGTSCNKLMLPMMTKCHDEWILHFYESMVSKNIGVPYITYILKKNRYFMECEVLMCVIPNFDDGIQEFLIFVKNHPRSIHIPSYLSRNDVNPAIILCDKNAIIAGINESCTTYFGIPLEAADIVKHECSLTELFVELPELDNVVLRTEGLNISIPTAKIQHRLPGELLEENIIEESKDRMVPELSEEPSSFWVKLVEETYGSKTGSPIKINICFLLPLDKKEEIIKKATMSVSKGRRETKKEEEKPQEDNTSMYNSSYGSSNSSSSTANSEARSIKEFKLKLYERKYPFTVTLTRRAIIILALVLFIMQSIFEITCDLQKQK